MYVVERYHDISAGHRVVGHEGKCQYLHGHNYRIHFRCVPEERLDSIGRVIDFGVVKSLLCMWLEENWDHRFLMWSEDPLLGELASAHGLFSHSLVRVPFNPTAEHMAEYLVNVVGPNQLKGTGVVLNSVRIEETRKCWVTYDL